MGGGGGGECKLAATSVSDRVWSGNETDEKKSTGDGTNNGRNRINESNDRVEYSEEKKTMEIYEISCLHLLILESLLGSLLSRSGWCGGRTWNGWGWWNGSGIKFIELEGNVGWLSKFRWSIKPGGAIWGVIRYGFIAIGGGWWLIWKPNAAFCCSNKALIITSWRESVSRVLLIPKGTSSSSSSSSPSGRLNVLVGRWFMPSGTSSSSSWSASSLTCSIFGSARNDSVGAFFRSASNSA